MKTSESPISIIPTTAVRNPRSTRTKGTQKEMQCFIDAVAGKVPPPIPFESLWATTLATFRIRESLFGGGALPVISGEEGGKDRGPGSTFD